MSSVLKRLIMRKILFFIFPLWFLLPAMGFSQLVAGRVLSEAGMAASGVKVNFKNKANTISTNPDGTFKIMASKLPDTLVFSAVGFEPYTVVITEKNVKDPHFEVVLLETRKELGEVVVRGYGAARKRDVTGSVSSVSSERLEGRVAGADIGAARGDKTMRIRGVSTEGSVSGEDKTMRIRGVSTVGSVRDESGKFLFFTDTTIGIRRGELAKSKILTAGEVNDFNKWKMWQDYTENEFNYLSLSWKMRPNKRYSIQLTDSRHNAVISEPVYLIDKVSRDTVWKAYTDNTGKAELWAGFFNRDSSDNRYIISDNYGHEIPDPALFSNGVNSMVVDRPCQVSDEVDIAFVVDATGSMGDEIEFLKLELEDVIRSTMSKYSSLTLNAASVFYRDKGDEYLTRKAAFNDDLLKTLNFIKLQRAGGGGDTPEAMDEALATAIDSLHWRKTARTRLLFLIVDAPPHSEARERMQQLILQAAAKGIRIIPIACSGTDKSTEFLLRSAALATNGTYTFLTSHSGVGNAHIEPTTDKYEAELLNSLLQRLIGQFLYSKDCSKEDIKQIPQQDTKQPANIFSVKIYPNPTTGRFTIESKKDIKEIFVADFTGKILMRLPAANRKGRWHVDISHYPSGMYFVKYITGDNKWGAEKVVLMR
jgi:hypothetical protein